MRPFTHRDEETPDRTSDAGPPSTRGRTGLREVRNACDADIAVAGAHDLEFSGHCSPNLHAHVAPAVPNLRHVEYFHDHERIGMSQFDGVLDPRGGRMIPHRRTSDTGSRYVSPMRNGTRSDDVHRTAPPQQAIEEVSPPSVSLALCTSDGSYTVNPFASVPLSSTPTAVPV